MKTVTVIVLALLISAVALEAATPAPDYWLFSWIMQSGNYHYAIVEPAQRDDFIVNFKYSDPSFRTVPDLETKLASLRKGSLVAWGQATCYGMDYPPGDIISRIEKFAAANGIRIIVVPGQCP